MRAGTRARKTHHPHHPLRLSQSRPPPRLSTSALQRDLWDIDEEDWDYAPEDVLDVDGETKDTGPTAGRKHYMTSVSRLLSLSLVYPNH